VTYLKGLLNVKALHALARWLHIYLSMVSFAILLFFAVTGLTLNHADWFHNEALAADIETGVVPTEWLGKLDENGVRHQMATNKLEDFFRQKHGVKGALSDLSGDAYECLVGFKGPGYEASIFIDVSSGAYELEQSQLGVIAIINDLHKGRDSGPAWSLIIDASAILMCLVSLTGLGLIFFLKRRRRGGLMMAIGGGLASYLLYCLLVP